MGSKAKKQRKNKSKKDVIKSEEMEVSANSKAGNELKLSTGSVTKKKKSKKNKSSNILNLKNHPINDKFKSPNLVKGVPGWSKLELLELVEEVEKQAPEHDHMKFMKRCQAVNWKMISIGKHSRKNCKTAWLFLVKRIRAHRSLKEMLSDAKTLVQNGVTKNVLGRPKKPKQAFDIFHHEMKDSIKEQFPEMEKGKESKYTSELYKKLSTEEKLKYIKMADEENRQYLESLKKFYEENPHLAPSKPLE